MSEEWGSDALAATKLRLVSSESNLDESEEEFNPIFLYPIFGQEETIFGYQGLEIQLQFTSGNLSQYLHISYDSKFPETTTVKADDPEAILYEFIPPNYCKSLQEFKKLIEKDGSEL